MDSTTLVIIGAVVVIVIALVVLTGPIQRLRVKVLGQEIDVDRPTGTTVTIKGSNITDSSLEASGPVTVSISHSVIRGVKAALGITTPNAQDAGRAADASPSGTGGPTSDQPETQADD